ncbi:MAG: AarF/ABC1/UbiB kinase family protein [Chloroflexaceae bacterium]|jgi:ubiquinone biosynthesis protein|nr:AarF/ABC1/UbiB kinase family protein [Chloroflexaceae bacterium]
MWPLVRQARYLGRYREISQVLVGHGFGYLVEQLGLASLLSLPRRVVLRVPPPTPVGVAVRLRETLIALGPTFIKFGQLLSTRPDLLPPDMVQELDKLQDTVPPFPANVAIATIESELGRPVKELFREFCEEPLAAASLGQVHCAVLHTGERVAVKVQRPDIQQRITTDLAIIGELAELAQDRGVLGGTHNLVELAWELSATVRGELDYRREGRNADRFRANFVGSELVHIPTVYWDYTTSKVLTCELLTGLKINDIAGLEKAGINRKVLARNSMHLILQEIFSDGFFHGDPHPGNFFALPGDVIGVVDFGQVGTLDRETTRQLLLLLVALTNHDNDGALRALERMGTLSRHSITPALRRDMQRFTDTFVDRPLADLSARETIEQLLTLMRRHNLSLPGPLATLLKALVMMEGIGLQLDSSLDVFGEARPYAERALTEQFTPGVVGERLAAGGRVISEAVLELPQQVSDALWQLNKGELQLQTRELELRRVAAAMVSAANRLAVALVLAAFVLATGAIAVAMGISGWSGWLPMLLLAGGVIGVIFSGFVLILALIRGRDW